MVGNITNQAKQGRQAMPMSSLSILCCIWLYLSHTYLSSKKLESCSKCKHFLDQQMKHQLKVRDAFYCDTIGAKNWPNIQQGRKCKPLINTLAYSPEPKKFYSFDLSFVLDRLLQRHTQIFELVKFVLCLNSLCLCHSFLLVKMLLIKNKKW